jgi:hypothetical protein
MIAGTALSVSAFVHSAKIAPPSPSSTTWSPGWVSATFDV